MIPENWLTEQMTVAEAEARHTTGGIAFGYCNDTWLKLKAQMRPGDELWSFWSPPETWKAFCGRAGVAVIRNGETIDVLLTRLN